jgi:hypothetical protein
MRRALVLLPVVAALAWPAGAEALVSCSHAGAAMTVGINRDDEGVIVARAGDAITVTAISSFGLGPQVAVPCSGASPTVTNTDQITINEAAVVEFGSASISLAGGPLAPGATPEPDGDSEIEVTMNMFGALGFGEIRGSNGPDLITFGRLASGASAANLNPLAEESPDADVEFLSAEAIGANGKKGRDEIRARGAAGLAGPLRRVAFSAIGGPGRDLLVGARAFNGLDGGPGRDRLLGSAGKDFAITGEGRDVAVMGDGSDFAISLKGGRDRVDCGGGETDLAFADRKDRHPGCDKVLNRFPGPTAEELEEALEELVATHGPGARRVLQLITRK